jgi:hypothetical protein
MRLTQIELQEIYESQGFISSDKYLESAGRSTFNFIKRDFMFRPGNYRGKRVFPIWANPIKYFKKPLVIGASDLATSLKEIHILKSLKVGAIFGTNLLNVQNTSESVPLGLTNNTKESAAHTIFGNIEHLKVANYLTPLRDDFNGSIYVNFSVANNPLVRNMLIKALKNTKGVHYDYFEMSDKARINYLMNLRHFSLVPCPEGNGIDTHRLWETLYMGGTPVIIRNKFLPRAVDQLPIIQLNNWEEISDIKALESNWYKIKNTTYDFSLLKADFWISRFESSIL